jgi:preprotein translocase subunit SecD
MLRTFRFNLLLALALASTTAASAVKSSRLQLREVLDNDDSSPADTFDNPSPNRPALRVSREILFTESDIEIAYPTRDNNTGDLMIGFKLTPAASERFGKYTESHIGKCIAFIFDGKLLSAPRINCRITGTGVISAGKGGFTQDQVDKIVSALNQKPAATNPSEK